MNSEDRALTSILAGKPLEKRVMVGYEGKKEKSGDKKSHLTDIMAEVRMPWFCPKCDKVMKHRNDNKMWTLFGHCFDCQIEFEHELRVTGKYEEWEEERILRNKIAMIKADIEELTEWKSNKNYEVIEPVNIDTGFVHVDNFELTEKMVEEADKAIELLNEKLEGFTNRLKELKDADE
tara:strand:+ start:1460 stop:1993 length:534 start_codon:yes stop_codon:yes gene_type:complete